jgi:iron(II)-dependent oxidoreductase
MGTDNGAEDEKPRHQVAVSGFWLGKFEVTNRQYAKYLEGDPEARRPMYWDDSRFNAPDQPVVGVTWKEAREYCTWAGLRLPTEAEWEYAAAAGRQLAYPTATGEISSDLANTLGTGGRDRWEFTSPVGSFPPNPFGLYDMAGNAWEWTSSAFADYPYASSDGREEDKAGSLRVLRGGSWHSTPDYCRSAARHRFASHLRYDYAGFRVAGSGDGTSRAK